MARHSNNEESETLSSYSLLRMDVSQLTLMNKTVLDVACDILDPKLFTKTLCSDTKFVTIHKYTVEKGSIFDLPEGVLDPLGSCTSLLTIVHYVKYESIVGLKLFTTLIIIRKHLLEMLRISLIVTSQLKYNLNIKGHDPLH